MSDRTVEPGHWADLRSRAAARLTGAAATKGSSARAADALGVLHTLASRPETASDALALLHELQVHQVELDMQAQDLRESRAELEAALRRQIELYDFQPVGSLTIDPRLVVHELNQTAARMLGIERDVAYGLGLDTFFCAESARRLRAFVAAAAGGEMQTSHPLQLNLKGGPERAVRAYFSNDPAAHRFLVALTNPGEEQAHQPPAL